MQAIFTSFTQADRTYELLRSGKTSFKEEFYSKDDVFTTFKAYDGDTNKSFIPCAFCNSSNTVFTFYLSVFAGTNTSGGTTTTYEEVKCLDCRMFLVFTSEDVSYPYD